VPTSEKHAVEVEYGLKPKSYGSTLEIDHIVSLELGGSNNIANLFPEKTSVHPGYWLRVLPTVEPARRPACRSRRAWQLTPVSRQPLRSGRPFHGAPCGRPRVGFVPSSPVSYGVPGGGPTPATPPG
jgi:hypothetical protein